MRRFFSEFMRGRYGADHLSRCMLSICVVLLLVNIFTRVQVVYWISLVILGMCYYRMLSRDYARRSAENQKYLNSTRTFRNRFEKTRRRIIQSKDFHIYKCPTCGQKIRIPRGKGRICITCPKCRCEFEKKS